MSQQGRINETETEVFDVKEENNTASNFWHAENVTEKDISYANIKTNGTKLAANDTRSKRLTQPRVGTKRVRRSAEMDGDNNEGPSHVIRNRQAKTDTAYDWSVDELSVSEEWQVDHVDPNRKVGIRWNAVLKQSDVGD